MSKPRTTAYSQGETGAFIPPARMTHEHVSQRRSKHAFLWPAFLLLAMMSSVLVNWTFLAQNAFAAPATPFSAPGQNTVQQFLKQGNAKQVPFQRPSNPPGALKPATTKSTKPLPSAEPATMKDMDYTLDNSFVLHRPAMAQTKLAAKVQGTSIPGGATPFAIKGNDGCLEVDVPRGSLDFTHAHLAHGSAPIGQLILQIHQISGHTINSESVLGNLRDPDCG